MKKIISAIFSFSGASILVGVAGFLSALVGMFVNTNDEISVKWFIFIIWMFLSFVILLFKLLYDASQVQDSNKYFEKPIKYLVR